MIDSTQQTTFLLGVIADTHGRLPAEVKAIFAGVDMVVHAGDIGDRMVLETLARIAPLKAVRGNMDWGDWARRLPAVEVFACGGVSLAVVHDAYHLKDDLLDGRCRVVISGHTHHARVAEQNGVLHLNPGSAGQPRSNRPATVALLRIDGLKAQADIIRLERT
jgi:putative phosphoesterase